MLEILIEMAMGAFGSLVRHIVSKSGIIVMPHPVDHDLDLGIVGGCIVGAFCGLLGQFLLPGFTAPAYIVSGMAGYIGADLLENLYQKVKKR